MAKKATVGLVEKKINNGLRVSHNDLYHINPKTLNQAKFFSTYNKSIFTILSGYAGTGKSFISMYKALDEVLSHNTNHKKIVVIRSAVQTREVGFLPGDLDEKNLMYERPYIEICNKLLNRGDAYFRLKEQRYLSFETTTQLRSLTFDNSIIILDEFQNCNFEELATVLTRVGKDSKLILCGDILQTDLRKSNDRSGFSDLLKIAKNIYYTNHIEFNNVEDICRSGFVKDFIKARIEVGI